MTDASEQGYPKPVAAWFTVFVLMIAFTLLFIDRQILSLLVDPISTDLKITDTQMSLVQGFAFAVFYTIFRIPLGALADRPDLPHQGGPPDKLEFRRTWSSWWTDRSAA